jgi:hypothetical protein
LARRSKLLGSENLHSQFLQKFHPHPLHIHHSHLQHHRNLNYLFRPEKNASFHFFINNQIILQKHDDDLISSEFRQHADPIVLIALSTFVESESVLVFHPKEMNRMLKNAHFLELDLEVTPNPEPQLDSKND